LHAGRADAQTNGNGNKKASKNKQEAKQEEQTKISKQQTKKQRQKRMEAAAAAVLTVQGFSSNELCLHAVLAAHADSIAALRAVQSLGSEAVLALLNYLLKWFDLYAERLPPGAPALVLALEGGFRIPGAERVVEFAGHCLDAHFARLAMLPSSQKVPFCFRFACVCFRFPWFALD
jgi:hypothetical protein